MSLDIRHFLSKFLHGEISLGLAQLTRDQLLLQVTQLLRRLSLQLVLCLRRHKLTLVCSIEAMQVVTSYF